MLFNSQQCNYETHLTKDHHFKSPGICLWSGQNTRNACLSVIVLYFSMHPSLRFQNDKLSSKRGFLFSFTDKSHFTPVALNTLCSYLWFSDTKERQSIINLSDELVKSFRWEMISLNVRRLPGINGVSGISACWQFSQWGGLGNSSDYPLSPLCLASHHTLIELPSRSVCLPLQRSVLQRAGRAWTSARNSCRRGREWKTDSYKTTEIVEGPWRLWRQLPSWKGTSGSGEAGRTDSSNPQ